MGKILVIGSSNTDLITKVERFPEGGETIEAISFFQAMGGKGANQAMAAHKLGGDVNFVTSVGNDSYGHNALKYYKREGLEVSHTQIVKGVSSGTALILVDQSGENVIVITPGANKMLSSEYIDRIVSVIDQSDIIVLQMEIPYETIETICKIGSAKGKKILLNVAPARPVERSLIEMIDILVVNETEAEAISGKKIEDVGHDEVIDSLLKMGAETVVLTLGDKGCCFKNKEKSISMPAYKVKVKDTTGAGDTFCGALAVGLAKNINGDYNWKQILQYATAASAICVTRMGAQPSIPDSSEVERFLENLDKPEHFNQLLHKKEKKI